MAPSSGKQYIFRGYTRPTLRGTVVAECIDLDLIVVANTQEDAVGKLEDAMNGYLRIAFERHPSDLVPRRAPWSSFAWYGLSVLFAWFRGGKKRTAFVDFRWPSEKFAAAC